jgi:hypothetical protein
MNGPSPFVNRVTQLALVIIVLFSMASFVVEYGQRHDLAGRETLGVAAAIRAR